MIENYWEKMIKMLKRQCGLCCCCGQRISLGNEKLDFCHDFPRTKKNIKNYPLMIDSIDNAGIGHNACNTARKRLNYFNGYYEERPFMTYYQAQEIEDWKKKELCNEPLDK